METESSKPSLVQMAIAGGKTVVNALKDNPNKIGAGSWQASMRLGLAEARQAVSLEGSIAQPTPYGMFGTPTPGQVSAAIEGKPEVTVHGEAANENAAPGIEENPEPQAEVAPPTPSPSEIGEDHTIDVPGVERERSRGR